MLEAHSEEYFMAVNFHQLVDGDRAVPTRGELASHLWGQGPPVGLRLLSLRLSTFL